MHDKSRLFSRAFVSLVICGVFAPGLHAQPAAPRAGVKPLPPAGIPIPAADRMELNRNLAALDSAIAELTARNDSQIVPLLPDVQIFQRAVATALKNDEFFDLSEVTKAKQLLQEGHARADQLRRGEAPWTKATGLVMRGYVSKIDGSVQPYGLVVPESYRAGGNSKFRLDVWLHGRNEKLSEINFLDDRRTKPGEFSPADTIVLHPYGRYCNAYKFAGEIDVLEAIDAVKRRYHVDDDRIAMRGFSMGGAGCWHLAVHYADRWMAAAPGAGFADTEQYLKMSDDDLSALTALQRKLFQWYDCPNWAANLYHCPTIAYNGEDDPQRQSADLMEKALKEEGVALRRIVGPRTQHKYHPDSKPIIDSAIASIAEVGREHSPAEVHLVTCTLRYNHMCWVEVDGLAEHWAPATVNAALSSTEDEAVVTVQTENVTDLKLSFAPGWVPFDIAKPVQVVIDEEELDAPRCFSDRSWVCQLHRQVDPEDKDKPLGKWTVGPREEKGLRKRPGLQGPIDDAFMDSFVIVRPTGKSSHKAVDQWVQAEMDRAIRQWRRHFRGDARVKDDTVITDADIASANLVLWGDAESNSLIKRIAGQLPIQWQGENIVVDRQKFSAADHVPVFIYPNPQNPSRYVVLNSGFTFRDADNISNAAQVPRLPDWAIIDLNSPPDEFRPGAIAAADFFGEHWELNPSAKPNDRRTAANFVLPGRN